MRTHAARPRTRVAGRVSATDVPRPTVPASRSRVLQVRRILAGSRRPHASEPVLHRYRSRTAANFGACDDPPTWVEKPFTDKENDPWIEKITVRFDGTTTDADGDLVPTGEVTASYHSNEAALPALSGIPVVGGKASEGLTELESTPSDASKAADTITPLFRRPSD